ncbi:Hypothetical predicted protein [Cloeon dipterum]|uniref:poly(ADP-ribose) glycohydrolase n=1 Tax=Cloeon dipterum TaxID=197152 RepID=A0A8S1CYL4_9INSE|nr:Hypothetical predicted protein [Cloeon dipterum]
MSKYKTPKSVESDIREKSTSDLKSFNFDNFHTACEELMGLDEEKQVFLAQLMSRVEQLAQNYTAVQGKLTAGATYSLTLTKETISQILAKGFLCSYGNSSIDFKELYHSNRNATSNRIKVEKLKCLFEYWRKSLNVTFQERVTFDRVCVDESPKWEESVNRMTTLQKVCKDSMFDSPQEWAQVVFANPSVGTAVLEGRADQEHCKFISTPELLACSIISDQLRDNEALVISGAHPYARVKGYAETFAYVDASPKNCCDTVIAIDAQNFSSNKSEQFKKECIDRELLKACAGFINCPRDTIVTGNWGGGRFEGDPELKLEIQWLAASLAGKNLVYYAFDDTKLDKIFHNVLEKHSGKTVGLFTCFVLFK